MRRSAPTCRSVRSSRVGAGAAIGARTDHLSERRHRPRRAHRRRLRHPLAGLDSRARDHRQPRHAAQRRVIGSDGFGFARQKDGTHLKIPQHGDVVIEDDVEIGANSTIDRPAIGETRISAGTKIDNLVHVAHGVAIGRRVLLAAQVGIAGSTTIGDDVMMAGQTGVTGHITRRRQARSSAPRARCCNRSRPARSSPARPAFPHADWRKASVVFRQLPSMKKRMEELEQRIVELEEKLAACQTPPKDRQTHRRLMLPPPGAGSSSPLASGSRPPAAAQPAQPSSPGAGSAGVPDRATTFTCRSLADAVDADAAAASSRPALLVGQPLRRLVRLRRSRGRPGSV